MFQSWILLEFSQLHAQVSNQSREIVVCVNADAAAAFANWNAKKCIALFENSSSIFKSDFDYHWGKARFGPSGANELMKTFHCILASWLKRIYFLQVFCRNWFDALMIWSEQNWEIMFWLKNIPKFTFFLTILKFTLIFLRIVESGKKDQTLT